MIILILGTLVLREFIYVHLAGFYWENSCSPPTRRQTSLLAFTWNRRCRVHSTPTNRQTRRTDRWMDTLSYINARKHLKMIEIGNFRKEMLHTKPPPGHGGRGLAVMTKIAPIIMKFGIESTSIISR